MQPMNFDGLYLTGQSQRFKALKEVAKDPTQLSLQESVPTTVSHGIWLTFPTMNSCLVDTVQAVFQVDIHLARQIKSPVHGPQKRIQSHVLARRDDTVLLRSHLPERVNGSSFVLQRTGKQVEIGSGKTNPGDTLVTLD
ncbi:hypothetical protein E3N88_06807 [Mikania micrantha]|uniref:Uncharacterized protein n=1 Tax=Mikania micrantha TaxID=192012 RepID=A0A5N6PQH2_9ASTR|nr:hypothetical protein E3N88_06807 [Mikania micrantha]